MNVMVNKKISSRFYHREDCLFVSQIPPEDRLQLPEKTAVRMGYCPCGCLKTDFSVSSYQEIPELPELRGLTCEIDKLNNTIYVRTSCGFWKLIRDMKCLWSLYHRNTFDDSLSTEECKQGGFHRQSDTEKQPPPKPLLHYIRKHDIANRIIRKNYQNLPKSTKKEREYYEQAKRKDQLLQQQRLDHLFTMLEQGSDNKSMLDF